MQTIIKSLFILGVAIWCALFSACNSNSANQREQPVSVVWNIDDLLVSADSLNGELVNVEGICTHVCQHGGKKLFLMGDNEDHTIRVEANEEIGQFSQDALNSLVSVTGILTEERIDEAYLVAWEEELKANTAEEHGKNTQAGCTTEKKARGENPESDSAAMRIADFRQRIAKRQQEEGKNYLSFYHIVADQYEIK